MAGSIRTFSEIIDQNVMKRGFKMKTIHNRFYNKLPKIGIRPTVDGRRNGVRESLEDMTMNLAKSVANLLTENLRHYNGEAVECVIADTCIGGVAESAQAAEKFAVEESVFPLLLHRAGVMVRKRWI